ncbi:hypothetical protein [Burkholderia cenocepacia]|uniref:hypothetical protein n=1 Tax=Burkholderia cenocepacia TaxID=95486 RepID=UPI000F592B5C|nr:hypothetical protein [Burkholderia cenocepacia]MDI9680978.1 hypothetical protein [Burkholderia cenocepacia]
MSDNPIDDPEYIDFRRRYDALPYSKNKGLTHVVSAHLVAGYFIDELLAKSYPGLPFHELRLSFERKVKLIEPSLHPYFPEMISALKVLGSMRNRIAHNLHENITSVDVAPLATAIKRVPFPPDFDENSVSSVVEAFARHVAMLSDVACITLAKFGPYGVIGFRVAMAEEYAKKKD